MLAILILFVIMSLYGNVSVEAILDTSSCHTGSCILHSCARRSQLAPEGCPGTVVSATRAAIGI